MLRRAILSSIGAKNSGFTTQLERAGLNRDPHTTNTCSELPNRSSPLLASPVFQTAGSPVYSNSPIFGLLYDRAKAFAKNKAQVRVREPNKSFTSKTTAKGFVARPGKSLVLPD